MASGTGSLLAHNQSVSVSYDTDFTWLGQGDFSAFPFRPGSRSLAHVYGSIVLNLTALGRYVLAVGGNEEAARLMGLPVIGCKFWTYVQSSLFAGLAGVILAAQFGAGQPAEGVGWELFSIAAVVVGGTLLTGGVGSVVDHARGRLLLGLIFNVLNFENGLGWISLRLLAVGHSRPVPDGGRDGGAGRVAGGAKGGDGLALPSASASFSCVPFASAARGPSGS